MTIYDGLQAAHDHLLDVAKACALAASKASVFTQRLKLRSEIITNEDIEPIIDVLESRGSAIIEDQCGDVFEIEAERLVIND